MIMNYNKWFYKQHQYLKNIRDGKYGYNDTKWITINNRYQKLVDMGSELLNEQPFLVHGNNAGFDKLLDLMGRSNYTFEDLDKAMINTYKMSLQNAMSGNLVNTHAVIFHTNIMDEKHVTPEKFTHYKIIDAPFNQLHFGHRDEFIRQKLHDMHITKTDYYMDIQTFNTSEISSILGFSIICSVNGRFSNDCRIAIDDKGFKFKVGWPWSYDVDFIVYKLDHCKFFSIEMNNINISTENDYYVIPYSSFRNVDFHHVQGLKCIINIYNKDYTKSIQTVPNFGVFTSNGLKIVNYQHEDMTVEYNKSYVLDIYCIKHLHELPNIYPAINYYDILDSRLVYDDKYERIKNIKNERILASPSKNVNRLEVCTPPIVLDRNVNYSFDTIVECLALYDQMMKYNDLMINIGDYMLRQELFKFVEARAELQKMYNELQKMRITLAKGGILTSLVSTQQLDKFDELLSNINNVLNMPNMDVSQSYVFNELYDVNYRETVKFIVGEFHGSKLGMYADMKNLSKNYFNDENSTRFNRPISEQCFIALKYHRDEGLWLFDYPKIKHFHGIGNTFYIDEDLEGNELYKLFVLYSDTIDPKDLEIAKFELTQVLDFDEFCNEVEKHVGCIRYWDAENRLMKISKILYDKYDDDTCVQVFSKIMKRKLNGDSLLKIYPSDINYEISNITTDNIDGYDENSERGPFAINFLFYTLSMLNDNKDKLQAYFYRYLVNDKFDIRYADIDISQYLNSDNGVSVKYSQITTSPSGIPNNTVRPHIGIFAYYGLPLILNSQNENMFEPYRYVMNVYKPDTNYNILGINGIDNQYYVNYDNLEDYDWSAVSYYDNIKLAKLVTWYIGVLYDYISDIQTNYTKTFNQSMLISSAISTIAQRVLDIYTFTRLTEGVHVFNVEGCDYDIDEVINLSLGTDNGVNAFSAIDMYANKVLEIEFDGSKGSIVDFINTRLMSILKQIYVNFGFDNSIIKRARMLYIHLKKINKPMNVYKFQKWVDNIDLYTLENLDLLIADNENYNFPENTFADLATILRRYVNKTPTYVELLKRSIDDLTGYLQETLIDKLVGFVNEVMHKQVFDLFCIDRVEYNHATTYIDRPHLVVLKLNGTHTSHINPPNITPSNVDKYIPMQPITDAVNGRYIINELTNVCEFLFFNGETLSNVEMKVYNENGTLLSTQTVSIYFERICSTADSVNEFNQILNCDTTELEFENIHESFEVVDGLIVNKKHADMNYELLLGNHFTQLDHDIEYVLKPETWVQGSIDKVYVSNQLLNRMTIDEFGKAERLRMFFKPVQVFHIPFEEGEPIESVYGKYFIGQTIYLKTYDGLTAFPVKVTMVDHSVNKGFIEAEVDAYHSKWFNIKDPVKITEYLTQNIECEVIDDNMRNFLDEFSNEYYTYYPIDFNSNVMDDNYDTFYKMPGDPIYVSSNSDYVYTRLNWFFNESIKNRFIDDKTKRHRFIYVGSGFIMNENDELKINMINHDFNNLSLPELYPNLRDEPNDHAVWDEEIKTFKREQNIARSKIIGLRKERNIAEQHMVDAKTKYDKEHLMITINEFDKKIQILEDFISKLTLWTRQLETPNTWFNVRSYGAAMVYIANGRANEFSPMFINNIRDLIYVPDMNVWLYDWENKQWLDPKTYEVEIEYVDGVKIDECDGYVTDQVLYAITIKPLSGFNYSKKILIYFSYNKSDIFNSIEMHDKTCIVRFKPLLSLRDTIDGYDPYANIRVRKHFDGYEKYKVDSEDIHINRVQRNGTYTYSPTFRVLDMIIEDSNGEHTWEDIDQFLIKSPFGVITNRKFHKPVYVANIKSDIDYFVPDRIVKLICISNNDSSSYNGNISSIMFEAKTSLVNNKQHLEIINTTLPNYAHGIFVCSVFMSKEYECVGGVVQISVTSNTESIYGDGWTNIPKEYLKYHEVPNEFKLVMKQPTTGDTIITLKNNYIKEVSDVIDENNENDLSPYSYYYDTKNLHRLPISNTRISDKDKRLVVDTNVHTDIKTIKAPYIGICRYSCAKIPENGLIDLTGYIPTPLSRERYEFWINGKCIINKNDLIILSPTSIQLCNLTSLKHFEVIELIDDFDHDNELIKDGSVYVDFNGIMRSSYRLTILNDSNVTNQDVRFIFNANNHDQIHDYTKAIIPNPNNADLEEDILATIEFDDNELDYRKLYNIPSINGVALLHPDLKDLGITEIPSDNLVESFDKVWKYEVLSNPLFPRTHRNIIKHNGIESLTLHVKRIVSDTWHEMDFDEDEFFDIYATGPVDKYFTLYISNKANGEIDDVENTVKIIPFVMSGTHILINKKYDGLWLHSTYDDNSTKIK